jgi:hypothetical protein
MSKIIANPDSFNQYIPEKMLFRTNEISQISNSLKNSINTFIYGPCGSGPAAGYLISMCKNLGIRKVRGLLGIYMESLCAKGLVKAVGKKRGRIYEIGEEDSAGKA